MAVYLDTETTGLGSDCDEILEIAIIDNDGHTLLNTLVKPVNCKQWDEAQLINGITPEMVSNSPTLDDISAQIIDAVTNQDVVIYNANFDAGFLGNLLNSASSINCCMRAYSEKIGLWDDYYHNFRWHKLTTAARHVLFKWPYDEHRALPDSLACRAVWRYLTIPEETKRIDDARKEIKNHRTAELMLASEAERQRMRERQRQKRMTSFIDCWWLRQYGIDSHWSCRYSKLSAEEAFVQTFFGRSSHALDVIESVDPAFQFNKQADIPSQLKPLSYFKKTEGNWCIQEIPKLPYAGAFVGKKTVWALYDVAVVKSYFAKKYPLRVAKVKLKSGEKLLSKTELKKHGYKDSDIKKMKPVSARRNDYSGEWYNLYKVNI